MSRTACLMASLLLCYSSQSLAQNSDQFIVTHCMFAKIKDKVSLLAQSTQYSLVESPLNEDMLEVLHENQRSCGKFLNVDAYDKTNPKQLLLQLTEHKATVQKAVLPISHDAQVQKLYQSLDPSKIWHSNQHLTSYINRYSKSTTGVAAADWFKQTMDTMAQDNKRTDVESYYVKTGNKYKQPSVVTIIGKDKPGEAIVIGAHIDTTNGSKPGADDDGSGISVVLEVARVLLSSELRLDRPVYFIAYAAEEEGLVGSSYVVKSFIEKKTPVKAVMQLDQAGYRANPQDNTIWLLDDYVDSSLTQFTADLLKHYVKIPVGFTHCGYACSDHANWHREGFSTCYPSATTLDNDNPYVHTSEDNLNILNLDHMVNFTKLGLAFVVELGLK